jgi:hypothetical protein
VYFFPYEVPCSLFSILQLDDLRQRIDPCIFPTTVTWLRHNHSLTLLYGPLKPPRGAEWTPIRSLSDHIWWASTYGLILVAANWVYTTIEGNNSLVTLLLESRHSTSTNIRISSKMTMQTQNTTATYLRLLGAVSQLQRQFTFQAALYHVGIVFLVWVSLSQFGEIIANKNVVPMVSNLSTLFPPSGEVSRSNIVQNQHPSQSVLGLDRRKTSRRRQVPPQIWYQIAERTVLSKHWSNYRQGLPSGTEPNLDLYSQRGQK